MNFNFRASPMLSITKVVEAKNRPDWSFYFMLTGSGLHALCKQSYLLSQRWGKTFFFFSLDIIRLKQLSIHLAWHTIRTCMVSIYILTASAVL